MRRGWILAFLLLSGCYSKATAYDGKFTFAYPSMVEHDNFVKPIAPGAKLEVHAFANGTTEKLALVSAKSSRPDVVGVASTKDTSVVLVGKTPGVAEIEVRAKDANGGELVDKMFFHVAKPAKHSLEHACTEEPEAAYVVGDDLWLYHSMKTADGRPVIGFDYAPFTVQPRGALELLEQPQADGVYLFKAKSAKSVVLKSTVDGQALTLELVDRKDLSQARLLSPEKMLVGRGTYLVARVSAGETVLCSQNALTKAKSFTPEICTVTGKLDDDPESEDSNREQLAYIKALAFGVCRFEVTLPELAKGKGVTLKGEVKVGREEYPRGSESDPGPAQRRECRVDERIRSYLDDWSRPLGTVSSAKDIAALAVLGVFLFARRRRIIRG
jgi:hypothetical protein